MRYYIAYLTASYDFISLDLKVVVFGIFWPLLEIPLQYNHYGILYKLVNSLCCVESKFLQGLGFRTN